MRQTRVVKGSPTFQVYGTLRTVEGKAIIAVKMVEGPPSEKSLDQLNLMFFRPEDLDTIAAAPLPPGAKVIVPDKPIVRRGKLED